LFFLCNARVAWPSSLVSSFSLSERVVSCCFLSWALSEYLSPLVDPLPVEDTPFSFLLACAPVVVAFSFFFSDPPFPSDRPPHTPPPAPLVASRVYSGRLSTRESLFFLVNGLVQRFFPDNPPASSRLSPVLDTVVCSNVLSALLPLSVSPPNLSLSVAHGVLVIHLGNFLALSIVRIFLLCVGRTCFPFKNFSPPPLFSFIELSITHLPETETSAPATLETEVVLPPPLPYL